MTIQLSEDGGPWAGLFRLVRQRAEEELADNWATFLEAYASQKDDALEKLWIRRVDIHAYWWLFLVPVAITVKSFVDVIEEVFTDELNRICGKLHLPQSQVARLRLLTPGRFAWWSARAQ